MRCKWTSSPAPITCVSVKNQQELEVTEQRPGNVKQGALRTRNISEVNTRSSACQTGKSRVRLFVQQIANQNVPESEKRSLSAIDHISVYDVKFIAVKPR